MAEWEERNNISTRKKKRRLKRKHKKSLNIDQANKENQNPNENKLEESIKSKEARYQRTAEIKVRAWIKGGLKESWLSFKNN